MPARRMSVCQSINRIMDCLVKARARAFKNPTTESVCHCELVRAISLYGFTAAHHAFGTLIAVNGTLDPVCGNHKVVPQNNLPFVLLGTTYVNGG